METCLTPTQSHLAHTCEHLLSQSYIKVGSVHVPGLMEIESFATVHQVRGELMEIESFATVHQMGGDVESNIHSVEHIWIL